MTAIIRLGLTLFLAKKADSLIQQKHWPNGGNTKYEITFNVPLESSLEGNWQLSLDFSENVADVSTHICASVIKTTTVMTPINLVLLKCLPVERLSLAREVT